MPGNLGYFMDTEARLQQTTTHRGIGRVPQILNPWRASHATTHVGNRFLIVREYPFIMIEGDGVDVHCVRLATELWYRTRRCNV